MKLVLSQDVTSLGKKGDIVSVSKGYARNYLFPNNLAIDATQHNLYEAGKLREARLKKEEESRDTANTLLQSLEDTHIVIAQSSTDEGTLYASVTKSQIVEAVETFSGIKIEEDIVNILNPVKEIGLHKISLQLSSEIIIEIDLEVVPEASN